MTKLEKARQIINQVDAEMAALFERRMDAARLVAEHKKENGLKIDDFAREAEIIKKNQELIETQEYKPYYVEFLRSNIEISKSLQHKLIDDEADKEDTIELPFSNIHIKRGALERIEQYMDLNRRVLIVSDSGVPQDYVLKVANKCKEAVTAIIPAGEASKNIDNYKKLLEIMVSSEFTRSDCVVAVGGGVVGDLAGFVASSYMRGIDFYNIPTTLLSMVDSSIGGKTAIDFLLLKNIVGAFWQPKAVVIDAEVLKTLDERQLISGAAEAIKMAATHDKELFDIFLNGNFKDDIETIIKRALKIKARVVSADERESGLRKVLNFGHTVGHAIESNSPKLFHGECVALGMLPMCSEETRNQLLEIYARLGLPQQTEVSAEKIIETMRHDKKMSGEEITVVRVYKVGSFELEKMSFESLAKEVKAVYKK